MTTKLEMAAYVFLSFALLTFLYLFLTTYRIEGDLGVLLSVLLIPVTLATIMLTWRFVRWEAR